ncbi:putative pectin lyase D [Punctularia strigosozonata HHB-11173 SS5]|uniref:putative pectin lyase D n=1 Tax=Punctularia strigosozonata (strain HHB-11173) TaxID=741275 RepID=UPI000441825D|nr:putative pectin lyase D [Punctularia strigosozonata HHB-11173 SS5]EIN12807.1 putative pectin lyase D [Punctularia strigosozonata HHB-11173 SS5]
MARATWIRLAILCSSVTGALAVGTALGFGSATVGGGSASPATPTSNAQLISWLSDSTQRVIVLDKVFDFTDYYGTASGKICKPWTCSPNPQVAIDENDWCENYEPSAATGTATWYVSGSSQTYSLAVGSKKTLLGKGSAGGIKGIGLLIKNADNVIIQNLRISDINAQFVWGGDAISIIGSTHVWIDHNYIQNVGRQMVVTGYDPAKDVTISNNVFDGRATYSALCDGYHYWLALFTGTSDTITFNQNHIYYTSGRGPHIGGTSGYTQYVHVVNNYYDTLDGHALDSEVGAIALVEGNYFKGVTTPSLTGGTGSEYFMQTSSDASTCQSSLGRTCQVNTLLNSGSVSRLNNAVLSALASQTAVTSYAPLTAAAAAAYVQASAGVGIVN